MVVQDGHHKNLVYVLPDVPGARIRLVTPKALQMGWCESPPFSCVGTERVRDVAEKFAAEPVCSLPSHPLEHHMMLPSKWPQDTLYNTCLKYLHVIEVYVDDFCNIV